MFPFKLKMHVRHLHAYLKQPISSKTQIDSIRVTTAYFALSGLDILGEIDSVAGEKDKYIKWLYHVLCTDNDVAGFQNFTAFKGIGQYWCGHIAATYSALNALIILGDDLSKLDKTAILTSLKLLQLEDGSYIASKSGTEKDMRFVYCAASICYILNDWSGMDISKTLDFIQKSISYDGGIGQGPLLESHGGSTYCAVATLALSNNLHILSEAQMQNLIKWLLNLQIHGFMGRPNKQEDTCYTFWVGATLKILGQYELVNKKLLRNFVLSAQDFRSGGFSKLPEYTADPLHTYFSLAGLALMNFENLDEIAPSSNMTCRAFKHLKNLHAKWCS